MSKLLMLRRSLIARMALLSVVFVVLALGWLLLTPIGVDMQKAPIATTEGLAHAAVLDDLDAAAAGGTVGQARSETLRRIAESNPRLRYFGSRGDVEVRYGDAPKWLHLVPAETAWPENENDRAYWSATFTEGNTRARVSYQLADGVREYVEIAGIESALPADVFDAFRPLTLWWASKNPLLVASGVFLIGFLVLLFAARSLRALTRTVKSFRLESGRHILPEKGLPTEVAPLVHAVNEMVARLEDAREQQQLFLAAAAHELRTPMTVLRTRLETLADSETKEELRADLRRMSGLVDQLLRLMSIGNHRDLADDVDLVATARQAVADHLPLAEERGVEVALVAETDALRLRGDRSLVTIALANLIDNALSFSKAGDRLEVAVRRDASVRVRDSGPGIPSGELERIFEPFAKIPPNRRGHGLGLAIVKAIMGLHGGTASARNVEGGAAFALSFRAAHAGGQ